MPTKQQYDAATAAVLAEMRADITRSVPLFLRSQIPDTTVVHYAGVLAVVALDAAATVPLPAQEPLSAATEEPTDAARTG